MIVDDWKRWYTQWDRSFSIGMLALGLVVVVCGELGWPLAVLSRPVIAILTVLWTTAGLTRLYRSVSGHTLADRITTLRLGFGAAALILLAAGELFVAGELLAAGERGAGIGNGSEAAGFSVAGVSGVAVTYRVVFTLFLVVAVLSDFLDGRIARRTVSSRFGEDWDMQNDAAFAMILSVAAVVFVGVGSWVLLIGLARYLFVLTVPGSHDDVTTPRGYDLLGKTVCAVTVISLAVVVAAGETGAAASIALATSLLLLAVSFGWSIYLLHRGRASTAYLAAETHASERVGTLD
ncbi:MAG: CDP-alcohol phosphatidyltransferase family protein [Spirochaetaceae bacterium]